MPYFACRPAGQLSQLENCLQKCLLSLLALENAQLFTLAAVCEWGPVVWHLQKCDLPKKRTASPFCIAK
jgi:hypothetical protein